MQKIESMKLTRCAEHMSFTYARGLRPALYKGLHATAARLVQKVVVPGIAHRNAIFGLKADSARPSDSFHPVRAFPLRRQLVGILGGLNTPKNKVAFLETSGINFVAMVAAQSLLVASSSHSSLKMVFLKEQRVILSQLLLLKLIISEHSR